MVGLSGPCRSEASNGWMSDVSDRPCDAEPRQTMRSRAHRAKPSHARLSAVGRSCAPNPNVVQASTLGIAWIDSISVSATNGIRTICGRYRTPPSRPASTSPARCQPAASPEPPSALSVARHGDSHGTAREARSATWIASGKPHGRDGRRSPRTRDPRAPSARSLSRRGSAVRLVRGTGAAAAIS
jgi:hypothetical protein